MKLQGVIKMTQFAVIRLIMVHNKKNLLGVPAPAIASRENRPLSVFRRPPYGRHLIQIEWDTDFHRCTQIFLVIHKFEGPDKTFLAERSR